jgi:ferritin
MSRFTDTLNAQIGNEFGASQQYVAIAVWYDAETLPQLAAFFYRQAVEERNHAMMLVQYLLDAGEEVVIPGLAAPQTTFGSPVEPVALALAQERRVTEQISALARIAREEENLIGEQYMQWFLKEQLEEMSSMSALLKTVERAAAVNILLAEDHLARTTAGGGAGVEADAPRAAGGVL